MLFAIWYHLYNLKILKNPHGGMSLLVKLQAYSTKSNTPLLVFFTLFIHHHLFLERTFILKVYQMLFAIWYHLCNLKVVKNTHGGMSLLVKLQAYFNKSNTPLWVFSTFLQLYK